LIPLLTAVCIGLPLGIVLNKVLHKFAYGGVLALGVATWTVAILSLHSAGIMRKKPKFQLDNIRGQYHLFGENVDDEQFSQEELKRIFDNANDLNQDHRQQIDPESQAWREIKSSFEPNASYAGQHEHLANTAFPDFKEMAKLAIYAVEHDVVTIERVPKAVLSKDGVAFYGIAHTFEDKIHLFVRFSSHSSTHQSDIRAFCSA
jgi:hypothetical protein